MLNLGDNRVGMFVKRGKRVLILCFFLLLRSKLVAALWIF